MGIFQPGNELKFAEIILPLPVRNTFIYKIPPELIPIAQPGKRVLVQFGKKKLYTGIISKLVPEVSSLQEIKEIIDIQDSYPIISENQIRLWQWMADYYCCFLGEVMAVALPSSLKPQSESKICLNSEYEGDYSNFNDKELLLLNALQHQQTLDFHSIRQLIGVKNISPVLKHLQESGAIFFQEEITENYKPKQEIIYRLHNDYHSVKSLQLLYEELEKAPRQLDVLLNFRLLAKTDGFVFHKDLMLHQSLSLNALNSLVKKGILIKDYLNVDRVIIDKKEAEPFELKDFQQNALEKIENYFKTKDTVLLQGITSSGKTHVYIKLIEEYLKKNKQVLYLVPEISLTAQLIRKLSGYFGSITGVYHSKYNPFERYETWHKVLSGEYLLIVGVRSAIFLPFDRLGLIIVDEEHENTYKQQNPAPRYHARDCALVLAGLFGAKTILGSATPSLESYQNAISQKYAYVRMTKRFSEVQMPDIELIDMKLEYRKKSLKGHLSSVLYENIRKTIDSGGQAILFINRRGYAPYIECQQCGWVIKCKRCDISLTYYKTSHKLRCHYCDFQQSIPSSCSNCGGNSLIMKGYGTEKIEDDISLLFPDIKFLRMDMDSTRNRKTFDKIITSFEKGEASVLIGTQMVTKGLDFEKVKLIGILNADQMMTYPDFRSIEHSVQLMIQVSGRAGRRNERGKVFIQTDNIKHPVFQYIVSNDYDGFCLKELKERNEFNYPPYSRLIQITLKTTDLNLLIKGSEVLFSRLSRYFGNRVNGPAFPPVMRIRNEYISNILLKLEKNLSLIQKAKKTIMEEVGKFTLNPEYRKIKCIIDVDPF